MELELVRKRQLILLEEFLHGVGLGQILGSFAVNAAIFSGYRLFGVLGGFLSGVAFLLPSVAIVIGLSDLYFRYHAIPSLQGAMSGLSPVVIALIVEAGWSIGKRVVRCRLDASVAVLALGAGLLQINTLWILLACAGIGLLTSRWRTPSTPMRALWIVPLTAVAASTPLAVLGIEFLKLGIVFFGGGYLLVPMLHHHLVMDLQWLTAREFVDGVAISNLTPGPIAVLATFAGYHLGGIPGSLIATAALLAPASVFMLFVSRQYQRFHDDQRAKRLLCALNPAICGLILSSAWLLGASVLTSWQRIAFAAVSLAVLQRLRWPPVVLLAAGALAGYAGLLP